jgi:hypothetical protein
LLKITAERMIYGILNFCAKKPEEALKSWKRQ